MKTSTFSNIVLSDEETRQMLKAFCYEALRFLKVSSSSYPLFILGATVVPSGKVNPLVIDYNHSRIIVYIPLFKLFYSSIIGNDAPTMFRQMGYQLARYWQRFIISGESVDFNPMDEDSLVFSLSLMVLKGLNNTPTDFIRQVKEMLKNEFEIDCELINAKNAINQNVFRITAAENKKIVDELQPLYEDNIKRPLDVIKEGQLGSKSNPFANVDDAADYILEIERERLSTDLYRKTIANEEYFNDGCFFRIPWASPNVSYYPIDGATSNGFIVNQLSTHNKFVLKPSLANNKFLYRGQSEFYSPCKSSLFREKKDYFVEDMIQIHELECLLKTHPLVKLFEQGFELLHDTFRIKINYDGLSQHYYNRTNWLDLTSNMEIAKFFAVSTFNMANDCYEKYTGNELGVLYYFDLKADSFQFSTKRGYLVDNIGKQPFMRSGNQSGFLINVGKNEDFNVFPDVRYVFFRHDPNITDSIFTQFDNGNKIMPDEILRRHWHKRMNDENLRKMVSTEAVKLNFANNQRESHNKIVKELQKKGFRIKNYHPSFTEEELDTYYSNALEFWEEFCSNIYFYSPEGVLMKEHLRNLPNDPRYRWAFVR